MVDKQTIKQNTERAFEMFNSGDLSALDEFYADDFTYRTTSGEETHGLDEFKNLWGTYNNAISDLAFDLEEIFVEGTRGVAIYRMSGTHTGDFQGIEASNNDVDVLFCSIGTFDNDGKIVDVYDVVDTLDLMRQLDALPTDIGELGGPSARTGA